MKFFPILSIIIALGLTGFCQACGGSGENEKSTLPDTTVKAEAVRDAERLNRCAGDENATVAIMLDIRAKESLMRAHSLDATADLYISTIEQLADCPKE